MGTRFWNCVGRCSQVHNDDEYGDDFSRNFGANPTASSGNGTSADDDRMQVDSLKNGKRKDKGKNKHQRGNRTTSTTNTSSTDINTCKNCDKPGHRAKDCWNHRGGAYDHSTCRNSGKGKSKHTGKGKGKHVDVVETEQPQPSETASTVSYPSQDPSVVGELSCISSVDPWIMGVTINSVSSVRRQAGDECLLLDSGVQLHACPISYPGQKIQLPDPGIHTVSGARLQHDGGRLVTYKLPEGRTYRVFLHARVQFRNQFCLLAVSLSRGTGVIFARTQLHCSFLTRSRPNTAKHSCTRKRVCSLSKGC